MPGLCRQEVPDPRGRCTQRGLFLDKRSIYLYREGGGGEMLLSGTAPEAGGGGSLQPQHHREGASSHLDPLDASEILRRCSGQRPKKAAASHLQSYTKTRGGAGGGSCCQSGILKSLPSPLMAWSKASLSHHPPTLALPAP